MSGAVQYTRDWNRDDGDVHYRNQRRQASPSTVSSEPQDARDRNQEDGNGKKQRKIRNHSGR
jgi:hypothetical protein